MKAIFKLKQMPRWMFVILFFYPALFVKGQSQEVQFMTNDKVMVTADLYAPHAATAPVIILFHQATFSRGEYLEIAPKLNAMGFNCLAVDLRSGEAVNGIENKTWKFADSLKMQTRFIDAYTDMRAALAYAKRKYPGAKIILFGSAYSASLAIKLASDFPDGVAGVVAFAPEDNFSKFGWNRDIIQTSAAKIKCPVFIASSVDEKENWQKIYDAIPVQTKVAFVPSTGGKHGAKTLWNVFPESGEFWLALKGFLARYSK
jgi:dienelactone hydrolase